MQAGSQEALKSDMRTIGLKLLRTEGIPGLYRGGLPLLIGGTLFRSAQFGVNDIGLNFIRSFRNSSEPLKKKDRFFFNIFDYEVIFGGFCGGLGRGIVEAPFEFVKVRRQVDISWKFKDIYKGSGITLVRNSFLFMFFMVYIDLGNQLVEGELNPFIKGSVCANLAWLTIWPLDVVKSQLQSGNFQTKNIFKLLYYSHKNNTLYRGLLPGLLRSSIANGCSMTVFVKVKEQLEQKYRTN